MTFVLFRTRIIVGPTITGGETDVMNQPAMRAAAEPFLYTQPIMLLGVSREPLLGTHA